MNLSLETDYALRVVYAFSRLDAGATLSAMEIVDRASIPAAAVDALLGKLELAGIIVPSQLADSGFRLGRPRREISLHDVIAAIDGGVTLSHCLKSTDLCSAGFAPHCKVHQSLARVQNNLVHDLRSINFDNM